MPWVLYGLQMTRLSIITTHCGICGTNSPLKSCSGSHLCFAGIRMVEVPVTPFWGVLAPQNHGSCSEGAPRHGCTLPGWAEPHSAFPVHRRGKAQLQGSSPCSVLLSRVIPQVHPARAPQGEGSLWDHPFPPRTTH